MRSSVLRMSDYKLGPPPTALGEWLAAELPSRSAISKPTIPGPEPESGGNDEAGLPMSEPIAAPPKGPALPMKGLISALVGGALVATAILFVVLWRGTIRPQADGAMPPAGTLSAASTPSSTGLAQPVQGSTAPEIALSSPDRIEAKAGEEIDFPIAIDATETLPSRCVIAVSAMPDGASFSEGRPYGATGWSLRPDEIGELRFRLPEARSGASDMRIELLAADGAVLAQSETRLTIAADPAEAETVSAVVSSPSEQIARAEAPKPVEALPPPPQRKPAPSAKTEPSVKVATVKIVTIKPPGPTRPQSAFALGEAAEAPAEWVEIVRPVDMHARPQRSSETVKVAEKGLKLRVTARNKDWVQVSDPATSANGWIYSRFLKPTEPPAQ
jgi:hypothetical protein